MSKILNFIKSKRYIFVLAGAVVVFFLLRTILLRPPDTEITYTVRQEDMADTIQVSGKYKTAAEIYVSSPTNGIIDKLFVNNNDQVKKGDELFHVESTATADQQKTAYANYLAATSTLKTDNANLYTLQSVMYSNWKKFTDIATNSTFENSDSSPNTTNRVLTEFTTVQDNWLASEANYKNQQAVIAKDQAVVSAALQAYNETKSVTVTAPIGGTIVNLEANEGDQVWSENTVVSNIGVNTGQAITNTGGGAAILIIANLANPYLSAEISEDYAAKITAGQKVDIVFDALKEQVFAGSVRNIDTVGANSQGITTYSARIIAEGELTKIKPGMTALIAVEVLRKNNVIDVPNSAILTRNGTEYVERAKSHELIPVMTGTRGFAKTEIVRGLEAGTVIAANPN